MENAAALALLKTDLGYYGAAPQEVEELMRGKLDQAQARLARCVELDLNRTEDLQLLVATAAYLYRKRDAGSSLPPMIREEIHDRQVARATGGGA